MFDRRNQPFNHMSSQSVQSLSQRDLHSRFQRATWTMVRCQATAWLCILAGFTLMPFLVVADRATKRGISDGLLSLRIRLQEEHGEARTTFEILKHEIDRRKSTW